MAFQFSSTPLLDLDLTTPSTLNLPSTIAAALATTGRTFSAIWKFDQASGAPTTAGSFSLVSSGSPRFQKTVPVWDGSSMTNVDAVEFPGGDTTTWFGSPNGTDWDLTQSMTFVVCMRLLRPPASDRGIMSKRLSTSAAGWMVKVSAGVPVLLVGDGSTTIQADPATVTNELDGFANGSLQWWAFKMNMTAGTAQVIGYRAAGTAITMPAGSKASAVGFHIGGMPVLFNCELLQVAWVGALLGSEAEAFGLTALNTLDTISRAPSDLVSYTRGSVVSPQVAYETGFGLRVQHCHGSTVTTGLVQFPHVYHSSATLSTQKLAAYFARGLSSTLVNKRNFYTQTDLLSHADWTLSSMTATAGAAEDPSGFTAATQLTATSANGKISQTKTVTANTAYAHSFYVRRVGGSDVSLVLRAVNTADSSTVGSSSVTATSEWTRVQLVSQHLTATSIRYELEIVTNGASIYATFAQLEYGWPTEYQPQRSTLIDRADPTYYIDNTGARYYSPKGGSVEVVAVQHYDNPIDDQYIFSTGLSDDATANKDRMLVQISDHNGSGGSSGTINAPYNTEVQHYSTGSVLTAQITNYNIDRNAEITYSYSWDCEVTNPDVTGGRCYLEQTGSATSHDGPIVPRVGWSAAAVMPKLYPGCRYTNTASLEGGIERLRLYGRHSEETTTISRIRQRIETVVAGLTPPLLASDRFKPSQDEGDGDFRAWAMSNPAGALRRFQVRDFGEVSNPAISNSDVEWREVIFGVVVAYPQSARYGGRGAISRDDLIESDARQIEAALAWSGSANFTAQYPHATWLSGRGERERADGIDFLSFAYVMGFYRSV